MPACLGGGSKAGEPIAPILLEGLKPSCGHSDTPSQTFLVLHNVAFQCTLLIYPYIFNNKPLLTDVVYGDCGQLPLILFAVSVQVQSVNCLP